MSRLFPDLNAFSNSLRKNSAILMLSVVLISATIIYQTPPSYAASEFNSDLQNLMIPEIKMPRTSGVPGTEVKIIFSNIIPVPENTDPRMEFFITLPFFEFGENVPSKCDGEYCVALYTFDEIRNGDLASKEITFTLFSKHNPEPIILQDNLVSVCDVKINDEIVKSFGYLCNGKDVPSGEYEINFGWGIQMSDKYDWSKTLTFTVTEPSPPTTPPYSLIADIDLLILQYENGLISATQFAEQLEKFGWSSNSIQKVFASMNQWTDVDSIGPHSASKLVDGLDLLTKPKLQFVSEQNEPVNQVEKENVDYDKDKTKSTQKLGISQEKSSSLASLDTPQDIVYWVIIAGVALAAVVVVALVKNGII